MAENPDPYVQSPTNPQNFNRYAYCLNNPVMFNDPSGELAWFVPVIVGAVVGAYLGGAAAEGWEYNPWEWAWDGDTWAGIGIGTMVGAGVGLGVTSILSASGVSVTGVNALYASNYGATSLAWDIFSNAIITSNINIVSSTLQGKNLNEICISGLVGFAAGAIGGASGSLSEGNSLLHMSQDGIKTTNYVTSGLNGFGDRFTNSLINKEDLNQAFINGLLGLAEGLYIAHYWGNKSSITSLRGNYTFINGTRSIEGLAGRYVSQVLCQVGTSVPGLGLSVATWHLSYAWYFDAFSYLSSSVWYEVAYLAGTNVTNEFGILMPTIIDYYFEHVYTNSIISPIPFFSSKKGFFKSL